MKKILYFVMSLVSLLFLVRNTYEMMCYSELSCAECPPVCPGSIECSDICFYGEVACCYGICSYTESEPEPSCDNYCSGNIRYYNGQASCTSDGWSCSFSTEDCGKDICGNTILKVNGQCRPSGCIYDEYECSSSSHEYCQAKKCGGVTYYCTWMGGTGWAWRTADDLPNEVCDDDIDNDCDGNTDCDDPDCAGKTGPNGVICCQDKNDCTSLKCGNYVSYCKRKTHECKCRTSCRDASYCIEDACCKYEVTGKDEDRVCVDKGTIVDHEGKSYLCDPPGWTTESSKTEESSNQKSGSLIFSFFKKFNPLVAISSLVNGYPILS